MNFQELQQEVSKYVYTEDDGMAKIALASIISNRLNNGDPIWLLLIGASSGGKSQILRPLALTDEKFIHRVDDLTENTLLSGAKVKKGEKNISLLKRIGERGIIVISDFTVIFSKGGDTKNAILGQFRMVYDGEMTKYSGNSNEPIKWKGSLGILAGSTPSIYSHFEEVADMGERFIYYRMKPYDVEKATRISLDRKIFGKELDNALSEIYAEYIKNVIKNLDCDIPPLSPEVHERIITIAMFAANLRTPTHYDKFAKVIDKVPVPEMPMRVALQLSSITKGLMIMNYFDNGNFDLNEQDISYIEWCAYSLANEERRACLKVLANIKYGNFINTSTIADRIGLDTTVVKMNLQHLVAIGVLNRSGDQNGLSWNIKDEKTWELIRRLEGLDDEIDVDNNRENSIEESGADDLFDEF